MNKLINDIRLGLQLNKVYAIFLLILLSLFIGMQYTGYVLFSTPNDKEVNSGGSSFTRSSHFYHK
ncbi:MAG: hypothetical protein JNM67_01150 [Bacteroidetes bacterium]|nr:hypothetical protein [Bacteroidota bacterium]